MSISYKTIDFTELDKNGDDFELLVREILYNKGLEVYWSGKGSDGGKDLLCIENNQSLFKGRPHRWLVQCKHNAHSGNSVGTKDLDDISNSCLQFNADGYILICSTFPSSGVVERLESIERNGHIITTFWDYKTLERHLLSPVNWSLITTFFPESAKRMDMMISHNRDRFWQICYGGCILYFALRIGNNYSNHIQFITDRISELNKLQMPEGHYLRLRAIYCDDKYCNSRVYYDYLIPQDSVEGDLEVGDDIKEVISDRLLDGSFISTDVRIIEYWPLSDNFEIDHYSYYSDCREYFQYGGERPTTGKFKIAKKDNVREITEDNKDRSFELFVEALKKLPFVKILKSVNSQIEEIGYFSDNFDWSQEIDDIHYNLTNFFEATVRFECENFDCLCKILSTFPQRVERQFNIEKNYIFLLDEGLDETETNIYTLRITIHPAGILSKLHFRHHLNNYIDELTNKINIYLKDNLSP